MNVSQEQGLDLAALDRVLSSTDGAGGHELIPILQEIQQEYGYLAADILTVMSEKTGIPISRIYGVATFYEQFHLEPHGRHTIRCCRGTACHVKGGPQIIDALKRVLAVEPGETTDDMRFTFETVACLGTCFLAPVMMVNSDYYGHLTTKKIKDVLENYR